MLSIDLSFLADAQESIRVGDVIQSGEPYNKFLNASLYIANNDWQRECTYTKNIRGTGDKSPLPKRGTGDKSPLLLTPIISKLQQLRTCNIH